MADTRNVAHDKKVMQEKKHHGEEVAPGAEVVPQPGKKPPIAKHDGEEDPATNRAAAAADKAEAAGETPPAP